MADARDQKPARDAFEDAERPARFEEVKWTAKDDDAAPKREIGQVEQPDADGILSSLNTFEEVRGAEPADDEPPLGGHDPLNFEEIKVTVFDPEPAEEAPLVDEGDDDGSIMFET